MSVFNDEKFSKATVVSKMEITVAGENIYELMKKAANFQRHNWGREIYG